MNPLPPHANSTLEVAKDTLVLSEKSGDRTLKIFGMAMLAVTGLATMFHAVHTIFKDLAGTRGKGEGRGDRTPPQDPPPHAGDATGEMQPIKDGGSERSWVRKARLAEHKPEGQHARSEHRHGHAQQR